jgi:predicted metal-binding membrane protein
MLLSASILALAAAAWLALGVMGPSAHASMHHHHHHGAGAGVTPMFALLFFVGNWTVMTIAMMLPTSLPVLTMFHAVAASRNDRALLVGLVVAGYLITWSVCGVLVHAAQLVIQQLIVASDWAQQHAWAGGGAILLLAGAYQFTPLKYRCLEKCRSPLSFVIEHWQGRNHRREAFRLGFDHGVFCVGCCWSLMLLMFVVGMTNLAWMLILAVVMAVEKNTRWGRYVSAPLGLVLLTWGGATFMWG